MLQCTIKPTTIHKSTTPLKGNNMYTEFEKQQKEVTKQFEELAKRAKQAYEFWIDVAADTLKMYKTK
jgi:predicted transcriptional regulator